MLSLTMRNQCVQRIILIVFSVLSGLYPILAQDNDRLVVNHWRLGLNVGMGTQQVWPLNNLRYTYDVRFAKIQINYLLVSGKFDFELLVQPEVTFARHQLLDTLYVKQSDHGDNFEELRDFYVASKIIHEYVLNIGVVLRKSFDNNTSIYVTGSVGPMIGDTGTERLHVGFAFVDVLALGLTYKTGRVMFDIRPSIRHVSNANLKSPNAGHNSVNLEAGILVDID